MCDNNTENKETHLVLSETLTVFSYPPHFYQTYSFGIQHINPNENDTYNKKQ